MTEERRSKTAGALGVECLPSPSFALGLPPGWPRRPEIKELFENDAAFETRGFADSEIFLSLCLSERKRQGATDPASAAGDYGSAAELNLLKI